ncbi:family 1 glycosylhydrolase [Aerococcaceae bacterium WGS1372]
MLRDNNMSETVIRNYIEKSDLDLFASAAKKVDFMGVNYYRSDMIEYNSEDGVSSAAVNNLTGQKGTSTITGIPGIYKSPLNPNLPTTDWDWTIDPMGLRIGCREITSRYDLPIVISENGLGAFDPFTEFNIYQQFGELINQKCLLYLTSSS